MQMLFVVLITGLAMSVLAPSQAWAQANPCTYSVVAVESAKAELSGPPPPVASLEWHAVKMPDNWLTRWPDYRGPAWYRIDWKSSCPKAPTAVAVNSIVMAGELFVNQDLIWRDEFLEEPVSRSWNMPRYWLLPASLVHEGTNSLWFRIHGSIANTPGLGTAQIGDPATLNDWFHKAWWEQRTVFIVSLTVSGVLVVLFAFAWFQNRSNSAFGWFALSGLCWMIFLSNVLATDSWPYPSTQAATRANFLAFIGFVFSFCIFTWRFGEQSFPWLERILTIITVTALAACVFVPDEWLVHLHFGTLALIVISVYNCLQFPIWALRTRKVPHLVLGACLPLFLVAGLHDVLLLNRVISGGMAWMPYTTPLTMLALAMVLGRQFTLNVRRVQRFNHELTESVTKACDDLSTTLEREHALALNHSRLQERMRISQDLHDSLGGSLVRSIALVEQAEKPLHNAQVLSMLKLMRDDLRQMIDTGTSAVLHAPATPGQWVAPLRHRFSGLFEELELAVVWTIPDAWVTAPSTIQSLTLTRVLEEALTNVIKHSRASSVHVELQQPGEGELLLFVTDDGIGFDVQTTQTSSMGVGMRSMLARIERVKGTLKVQSTPGHTVLQASIALGGAATRHTTSDSQSMV